MHLIIYGPEGSGKGTQAEKISAYLNIPVLTSGDLVRAKAKENNDLGKICLSALEEGKYVRDDVMFKLWEEKLKSEKAKSGFILDGFPRNVHQAEFLFEVMSGLNYTVDKFVYIRISDLEARTRLLKRNRKLVEGSSESHDSPERVNRRLTVFHEMELPLVEYFKEKNLLLEINGQQSQDEVFQEIKSKLGK